jgi:hypothetical protein
MNIGVAHISKKTFLKEMAISFHPLEFQLRLLMTNVVKVMGFIH